MNSKVHEQALKSLASWADLGLQPDSAESIVQVVFHTLHNVETFDAAVDAIVKIFSHPEMDR